MTELLDRYKQLSSEWTPENRAALLQHATDAVRREQIKATYANAAELAQAVDPRFRITPAIELAAANIEETLTKPRHNLVINWPPQEGKTTLCAVFTPLRALQLDPSTRIVLATHGDGLAEESSAACRTIIREHGSGVVDPISGVEVTDKLGFRLAPGQNKVKTWKIAGARGGMHAVGWGSSLTGRPADLLIIDDVFKNQMEADSDNHRRKILEWFKTVALTRLSPRASIIHISCMTGDTPVLRPDGTETPLRDIRPGDRITTYENGHLTSSFVRNWANQGPDIIFTIRMKSGRCVRANARHPFLVVEGGREIWRRTRELTSGHRLVALDAAPGNRGRRAPSMAVKTPPTARACALPTTCVSDGQAGTAPRLTPAGPAAISCYDTDTASPSMTTTRCSRPKTESAPSAAALPRRQDCRNTGTGFSASITTTKPGPSATYCATTAMSDSGGSTTILDGCAPPPTTSTVTTDEIVTIEFAGVEDVFDIEVERTGNFIANGLVSHNTRWHEKDLSGEILAGAFGKKSWRHINIPAIAEKGIPDALGRQPGEVMVSARGRTKAEFEQTRASVGERVFYAMYQGVPRPPAGGLFQQEWFSRHVDAPEYPLQTVVGIDPADTGKDDETGIIAASLAQDGRVVFVEDWSGQMTSDQWGKRAVMLALQIGASEIAMEAYTTATTYVQVIKRAYRTLHEQAVVKRRAGVPLLDIEEKALTEQPPFIIYKWRGGAKVDAIGRSALLRQSLETGRAVTVEDKMDQLQAVACGWQIGQHQPDRVAAAIIAHDRLARNSQMAIAAPPTGPTQTVSTPEWLRRSISSGRRGL